MEQRFVIGAVEETGEQDREERIAYADGVSHFDLESGMLGPSPFAPECGAVATARDANDVAVERFGEDARRSAEVPPEVEPRCEATHLILVQLHDVSTPKRVTDDFVVVVGRAQVHVQNLEGVSIQNSAQRVAGNGASLRECSEDDRLRRGCTLEQ